MQKKYFISFGGPTENWHNRVNNICAQVQQLWTEFETIAYTEKDLLNDTEFWQMHKEFLEYSSKYKFQTCDHTRYGFYIWKPYIIFKTMQKMQDNDILIYADAGCTINPSGIQKLSEFIDILNNNQFGMIAFQNSFPEIRWTKTLLFKYFNSSIEDKISNQYIATSVFLKKTTHSFELVQKWHQIASNHMYIDNNSYTPEDPNFVEHRHDQSIFSLLVKYYNKRDIKPITIQGDKISDCLPDYPILGTRIRQ